MACMEHICVECEVVWFDNCVNSDCAECGKSNKGIWDETE